MMRIEVKIILLLLTMTLRSSTVRVRDITRKEIPLKKNKKEILTLLSRRSLR